MKKLVLLLALAGMCFLSADAQKKIPDTHRTCNLPKYTRTEIILPVVKGYNCYKADLHVHTIYSDGDITPRQRVREAWYDGLDILAITDHLEARRYEQYMLNAHAPYNKDGKPYKYRPAGSARMPKDGIDPGITCNLDATFEEARECVEKEQYPLLLIKGTEISRNAIKEGHFNALFVTDIMSLYNIDTKETFRNVHKQGGIVIHNHPAYRRNTTDKNEWHEEVYKEGLIDGVEVVNGWTFYPKIVRRCIEEKLIMAGGTDTHRPTSDQYKNFDFFRTMTIILAKENTEKAIKDALLKRRTIVYSGGQLMGEEKWLQEFANAAVDCRFTGESAGKKGNAHAYTLTNNSSITLHLRRGKTVYKLEPFKSFTTTYSPNKNGLYGTPKFTITNMWHVDYKHPVVDFKID